MSSHAPRPKVVRCAEEKLQWYGTGELIHVEAPLLKHMPSNIGQNWEKAL